MDNQTDFLDNQLINAEDLNNIALDLGHPDFSFFPENPPDSAVQALNNITKDLATHGILPIGDKCAWSFRIVGGDVTYTIGTGVIIFRSGAKIRLNSPVSFSITDEFDHKSYYIYALYDPTLNKAEMILHTEKPTESTGDYVPILGFDINSSETTDMRIFAASKLTPSAATLTSESPKLTTKLRIFCTRNADEQYDVTIHTDTEHNEGLSTDIAPTCAMCDLGNFTYAALLNSEDFTQLFNYRTNDDGVYLSAKQNGTSVIFRASHASSYDDGWHTFNITII